MVKQLPTGTAAEHLASLSDCAAGRLHALGHALQPCVYGLTHCNPMLCLYAGIGCGALMMAWNAWVQRDHHHMRAHGFTAFVNLLEALLHIHG